MKKIFCLWFFIQIFLSAGLAFAVSIDFLQTEHGKGFDRAPFYMRYKFQKSTGTAWDNSAYEQRKTFLENWYIELKNEQDLAAQAAKSELEQQREIEKQKIEKKRRQQERIRNEQELKRRQEQEKINSKKVMEDRLRQQEREIKELRDQDRKIRNE